MCVFVCVCVCVCVCVQDEGAPCSFCNSPLVICISLSSPLVICIKTMWVKGGVYAHEAYEAKKKIAV